VRNEGSHRSRVAPPRESIGEERPISARLKSFRLPFNQNLPSEETQRIRGSEAYTNMAHLPKRLTGDQAAINQFLDQFDVRSSLPERR
jgi:hypothetical protein